MDFTAKYTDKAEEKLLLKRVDDLIRRSEKTFTVLYTSFLTPAEQGLLMSVEEFRGRIGFDGGYEDAERRLCRICTDEYAADSGAPYVIYKAETTDPSAEISHRDVLGALMGLGIKREMIGDIFASGRIAQFFCIDSISEFVELNLDKIGRYRIRLERCEASELPQPETEKLTVNVSSMRLDSICAGCFGMSRIKASEAIKKGLATLNWTVCPDTSHEIKVGDRIALRGSGKLIVGSITGVSKKGRLFVAIEKYK